MVVITLKIILRTVCGEEGGGGEAVEVEALIVFRRMIVGKSVDYDILFSVGVIWFTRDLPSSPDRLDTATGGTD